MKLVVVKNYKDLMLGKDMAAGETIEVEPTRAMQLMNIGVAKEVIEEVGLGMTELPKLEAAKKPRKKKVE